MQDITSKQINFTTRYVTGVTDLMMIADRLATLKSEWDANAYATGADPEENNITDEDLWGNGFAYMNALQLNQAVGGVQSILATVAANRGYLEALRP